MSLEVDKSDQLPEVQQQEEEGYKFLNNPAAFSGSKRVLPIGRSGHQASPRGRSICGLRLVTFVLGLTLVVFIVLAIVAAAVGGSLAEERKHASTTYHPIISSPSSSSSPTTPVQNATSPLPSSIFSNATTILPSTDCSRLDGDYTSTQVTHQQYRIACEAYVPGDYNIMAVFVYYFEDCIEACSNYNFVGLNNNTCSAAIYVLNYSKQEQQGLGNCFLKNLPQGLNAVGSAGSYLATLVQS